MNVFQFNDIKGLLKYYISTLPKKGRGEIIKLAQYLGVSSTLISHVLSGEKNLTPEQAGRLTTYLGLNELETDYFNFLIQQERAGTHELKKFWNKKLKIIKEQSLNLANRMRSDQQLTQVQRSIFYSSPIYMAIRLYTSIGDKGKTLSEISQRFEIKPALCLDIMAFLVECGLCNETNGQYTMGPQTIFLDKTSPHLLRFHTDWRLKAINHKEEITENELMFTAPISLSKSDFELLRESTVKFIKNFLDVVHNSPAEEVACINIDFFWVKK